MIVLIDCKTLGEAKEKVSYLTFTPVLSVDFKTA